MKPKPRASEIDSVIGQNIRSIRADKGLSQTELAQEIGVSFQQLQKYESGTNRISAANLSKIANYTEEPFETFFHSFTPTNKYTVAIDKEFYELFKIYQKIPDQKTKNQLKNLLTSMLEESDEDAQS